MGLKFDTGYTDDGQIYFKFDAPSYSDGTPLTATLMVSRQEAEAIATRLMEAVDKSRSPIISVR